MIFFSHLTLYLRPRTLLRTETRTETRRIYTPDKYSSAAAPPRSEARGQISEIKKNRLKRAYMCGYKI